MEEEEEREEVVVEKEEEERWYEGECKWFHPTKGWGFLVLRELQPSSPAPG